MQRRIRTKSHERIVLIFWLLSIVIFPQSAHSDQNKIVGDSISSDPSNPGFNISDQKVKPGQETSNPHEVCLYGQISGKLVGHIISICGNVWILRPYRNSEQRKIHGERWMALFEGDTIKTEGQESMAIVAFYSEWIRSGWKRSLTYYQWDTFGNPQRPYTYKVPDKDTARDFWIDLDGVNRSRYFSALRANGLEIRLGSDTVIALCVDSFIDEADPIRSICIRHKQGLMRAIRTLHELSPEQVFVNMAFQSKVGIIGTDVVFQTDPGDDMVSIHVHEGEVSFTNEGEDRAQIITAGKSIVIRGISQPEIFTLDQNQWENLIKKSEVPRYDIIPENERFIRDKAPVDFIPDLKAVVIEVRFYESSKNGVPYGQREYRERFASSDSRFINWELNLKHQALERSIDFNIDAFWYDPEGNQFARETKNSLLEGAGIDSYHSDGRGWNEAGNWKPGVYIVELFYKEQKIAIASFEIF